MVAKNKRSKCSVCSSLIKKGDSYFVIFERVRDSRELSRSRCGVCPKCIVSVAQDLVQGVEE